MSVREEPELAVPESEGPESEGPELKVSTRLRYESFLTPRLEARAISWDHRDEILGLYGNAQVGESFGGASSAQEVDDSIERNLKHWERWGWGPWSAYDRTREGSPFVGQILLRRQEIDGVQEVEIGYALMPQYWRQGLGTESADALAWLGLEVLGLEDVVAYTWVENTGSWRVMEKIGMREEKRFPFLGQEHVLYRLNRKQRRQFVAEQAEKLPSGKHAGKHAGESARQKTAENAGKGAAE